MSDPNDESWKLELLAARPDMEPMLPEDDCGDGSALLALMERSGGRCWYCGCRLTFGGASAGTSITREHLLPRSRGGSGRAANIVGACRACNTSKQAKTVEEYRESLSQRLGGSAVMFFGEQDQ